MYHPTTRLLTILELLQAHPVLSSDALARRLEVEPRSVRRYITMLQDMGMPIEAVRGPGGGYRLRPGFKLPPLMLSEEEATAVVLGLLGTAWLELGQPTTAVEGALAKVLRVLPLRARERLSAVAANLVLSSGDQDTRPQARLLIELSEAIQLRRRAELNYRSRENVATRRSVEPYRLAGWWGRWYLAAYCCLRRDYRLFRLDRVEGLWVIDELFVPDGAFDAEAYIATQLGRPTATRPIVVEFQAPLPRVRQQIPASYGSFEETPGGVRFTTQYGELADIAQFLVACKLPFVVHEPPALREELLRLAAVIVGSAGVHSVSAESPEEDACFAPPVDPRHGQTTI
ncbi:MAG TPA: YafY family protein [Chloroflexaceae bacterium]|nr:YafY family protein [Chloroflexaceae bacterium]